MPILRDSGNKRDKHVQQTKNNFCLRLLTDIISQHNTLAGLRTVSQMRGRFSPKVPRRPPRTPQTNIGSHVSFFLEPSWWGVATPAAEFFAILNPGVRGSSSPVSLLDMLVVCCEIMSVNSRDWSRFAFVRFVLTSSHLHRKP